VQDQRADRAPRLLGGFDPLTVGIGRRDWFLRTAHTTLVSRTAGWISPVVLLDGTVAGLWNGARRGDRYAMTVDLFERADARLRRRIEVAAERVAAAHSALLDLCYGSLFGSSSGASAG
jgi:winged helix DNA-binding protein